MPYSLGVAVQRATVQGRDLGQLEAPVPLAQLGKLALGEDVVDGLVHHRIIEQLFGRNAPRLAVDGEFARGFVRTGHNVPANVSITCFRQARDYHHDSLA